MNPPPTPAAPNDHPPQPPPSSSAPPPPHNLSQPPTSSSSSTSAPQYPPPPPPPPPPSSLAVPAVPGTAGAEPPPLGPSKNPLDAYPWTELEERFIVRMEAFGQEERDIQEEFAKWVAVFAAWASVTSVWEEERGYKRLRTRISWVQNAEKNLEEKRLHYVTAIKAFENVVALLNGF